MCSSLGLLRVDDAAGVRLDPFVAITVDVQHAVVRAMFCLEVPRVSSSLECEVADFWPWEPLGQWRNLVQAAPEDTFVELDVREAL